MVPLTVVKSKNLNNQKYLTSKWIQSIHKMGYHAAIKNCVFKENLKMWEKVHDMLVQKGWLKIHAEYVIKLGLKIRFLVVV